MQNIEFPVFPQLVNEALALKLLNTQPEATCNFHLIYISSSETKGISIKLQIMEDCILQKSINSQIILSCLQFQYENRFLILYEQQKETLKKPNPYGIEFRFRNRHSVTLKILNNQQNLRFGEFIKAIEKKYIRKLNFHGQFKAYKRLGKGMSASVYKAFKINQDKTCAIKAFSKKNFQKCEKEKNNFQREFKIMTKLDHKNIVKLQGVYQTQNSLYMTMQLYELSMLNFIVKYGFPTIQATKFIIINLLLGLQYLHSKKIMHRDLKLENIMFKQERQNMFVPVIIDFGLAQYSTALTFSNKRCGTPGFTAPEILNLKKNSQQKYDQSCDMFSLGIVSHLLIFKKHLFKGENVNQILQSNRQCEIDFNQSHFVESTKQCMDFMRKMLQKDPKKRMNVFEALSHPFLKISSQCYILQDGNKVAMFSSPNTQTF